MARVIHARLLLKKNSHTEREGHVARAAILFNSFPLKASGYRYPPYSELFSTYLQTRSSAQRKTMKNFSSYLYQGNPCPFHLNCAPSLQPAPTQKRMTDWQQKTSWHCGKQRVLWKIPRRTSWTLGPLCCCDWGQKTVNRDVQNARMQSFGVLAWIFQLN